MDMRATIGTFGRRIVWATITLCLLTLAGTRSHFSKSDLRPNLSAAYRIDDSGCLSPFATQEEIDAWSRDPNNYIEDPSNTYTQRGSDAVFGQELVWSSGSPATLGASGSATPTRLRYSFPSAASGLSGLYREFQTADLKPDEGLELIRQGLAAWSRDSGVLLDEVADPDSPLGDAYDPDPGNASDIRIWGNDLGLGALGITHYPEDGGDIWLHTNRGSTDESHRTDVLFDPSNRFRILRNTVTHESGHALGFFHVLPITRACMMETPVVTTFEGLSSHEKRASGNFYGDRYSGRGVGGTSNWTFANAVTLDDLSSRSVNETDLSTNGEGTNAGEDWFAFTLSSSRSVTISVNPTGGSYWYRHQYGGAVPIQVRHAERAGNLAIDLANNSGTVIASTNAGGPGETETLNLPSLPALPNGEMYKVRVYDVGPNPDCDMVVQLYDLSIRVGESLVPPRAIAGINKRIAIGNDCYFMGQFYSHALEPGAAIIAYEWDPGESGILSSTTGEVHYRYTTTGTKTARLRVQDSFGTWSDWDEIKVVVY